MSVQSGRSAPVVPAVGAGILTVRVLGKLRHEHLVERLRLVLIITVAIPYLGIYRNLVKLLVKIDIAI